MKKITFSEAQKLQYVYSPTRSVSKIQKVIESIKELNYHECLIIEKEDWVLKTDPRQRLRNIIPEIKISVRTLDDASGWVVTRL